MDVSMSLAYQKAMMLQPPSLFTVIHMEFMDNPSTSTTGLVSQLPSLSPPISNSRNSSSQRRTNNYDHQNRSPLSSDLWISVELTVNVSQIVAADIVLSLSRHEHPQTPLFLWIVGYTIGYIATLPHLYWRYLQRNIQSSGQNPAHPNQGT